MGEHVITADRNLAAAEEWARGWRLLLACLLGFSFFSIASATVGVFMDPLGEEFGWSRTLLSAGVSIAAITTALLSPFFGILIDRYGPRRVALPGLVATILALCAFSLANGSAAQWLMLWTFYAVISISVKTTVWTAAVVGAFTKVRGLALGIMLSGTAAAQAIVPPLATWLISEFGWRMAYVWLSCVWGGPTLLVAWLFLRDVQSEPKRTSALPAGEEGRTSQVYGLTLAEARSNSALWRINLSTFFMMLLTMGLLIHQIPILTDAGISRENAAWLAGLAGLAGIVGKLATGVLLDRFRANLVGGITIMSTAFAFLLLIDGVRAPVLIVIAMLVNGYSAGSKLQIASYLTARYAGTRNFGAIYGFITSLVALGTGLGPMIAGLIYDSTGGYVPFLLAGTAGSVLCGLLLFSLPGYPTWRRESLPLGA